MKVRTLVQWDEPIKPGQPPVRHEPGEVADIDPQVVFDLPDLLKIGTVEEAQEEAAPARRTPKKDGE